ncbi:CPBP family intramembrane glutamic endopeptidase [Maribellus sp. YY47]|uniref:CPBP family intramembrane glutamic endopeptidase n=1 Tax=Maribellus sp. YY47 TaxID=2929486 RepID=UPI0020012FCC|nr:CPBP family intramembrane glutamic endopeptidase [Maribellus sp. YY47]MCK3683683.1 CPBP family intramembrane metalloprotease [Maribellus sp. YY47]
MAITAFRGMKPFPQLLFSAFVILVCFLTFLILSLIIAVPVFGFDSLLNLPTLTDLENPESLNFLKYFQTVQAIGLFVLPPLILAYLYQGSVSKYLYLNTSFRGSTFLLVIVLMVFMMPFINFTAELNSRLSLPGWLSGVEEWMRNSEDEAARLTEAFLDVKTIPGLAFNLFMVAFLPAIGEELLFRGVIQKIFTRMTRNHHWGIWISAILFSAMHMQFFGFFPRMFLGAVFGYLLVWSGSMWLPMLGHFLNNAMAVIAMFLVNNGTIGEGMEDYGATSYFAATFSFLIIAAILYLIKKENNANAIVARDMVF